MSIAQRQDGRYLVKYKVNGQWKQRTFRDLDKAKAFEAEGQLEEEVNNDTPLTVGELAVTFLRSERRGDEYIKMIERMLFNTKSNRSDDPCGDAHFLFNRYCESLTRRDFELLRENMRVRGLCNATINRNINPIKAMLNWGVEQDLIARNPWRDYKRLTVRRRPISVSHETMMAVYQKCRPWLQWAVKTAYCLCLRPGHSELFSLKWNAFDFVRGAVTVIQGKSAIPKTVIPPEAYMAEARERCAKAKQQGIELVCPNAKGRRVGAYYESWRFACKRAGVTMRLYDIRHLAATTMLASGADIVSVAAQLGHQNCAMTGEFYAHVISSAQKTAAKALVFNEHLA